MLKNSDSSRASIRTVSIACGLLAFLILCTINGLVTTDFLRDVVTFLRPPFLVLLLVASFLVFYLIGGKAIVIRVGGAFLALCGIGYALARWNGVTDIGLWPLTLGVLIGAMGGILLISQRDGLIFRSLMPSFLLYALIGFMITAAFDGFVFLHPLRFIFEYFTNQFGVPVLYSQATSKLFGVAALGAVSLSVGWRSRWATVFGFFMALGFLVLSLLAAARGESAVAVIMVISVFLAYRPFIFLSCVVCVSLLLWGLVDHWAWMNDYLIVRRWGITFQSDVPMGVLVDSAHGLADDLGMVNPISGGLNGGNVRGQLLSRSFDLLISRSDCLWHGCGFGFFQSFYNLSYGYYPHNQAVEMVITFGLPITVVLAFFVGRGFLRYIRSHGLKDPFVLFFIYAFVCCLKSGALFTDAMLVAGFFFFTAYGFRFDSRSRAVKLHES